MAELFGTAAADAIVGTSGSDTIFGLIGEDTISGEQGDDSLYSGKDVRPKGGLINFSGHS